MPFNGETVQPVDFRPAIRQAIEHADALDTNNPLANPDYVGCADKPDDYLIIALLVEPPDTVFTEDKDHYPTLLRQAVEVQIGSSEIPDDMLAWIEQAVNHEIAHGNEASKWCSHETSNHYGVKFVVDEDERLILWPLHAVSGPIKKIHAAATSIAPEDRSFIDLEIVRKLGYDPTDIVAIRNRAADEPPTEGNVMEGIKEKVLELLGEYAINKGSQDDSSGG